MNKHLRGKPSLYRSTKAPGQRGIPEGREDRPGPLRSPIPNAFSLMRRMSKKVDNFETMLLAVTAFFK
jgi:hypothetical protein